MNILLLNFIKNLGTKRKCFFQWYQINKPIKQMVILMLQHKWTQLIKMPVSETLIKCVMEVSTDPHPPTLLLAVH